MAKQAANDNEDIADDDSDDEDDDGEEIIESDKSKDGDYLVPTETEAQMQLLWRFNSPMLDFIWGRALLGSKGGKLPRLTTPGGSGSSSNNVWKLFFSRCVLVPPNRFRPAAKVGDATSEHPQVTVIRYFFYKIDEKRI